MTSPNGAVPEGALGVGMFAARQAESEDQARARATNGAWKSSWNNAQDNIRDSYAKGDYVQREVVRLDNRIDNVADELGILQIATYGFSARWQKPPGAFGDLVIDIIGGASGGGRSNNGGSGGAGRIGLGGWSGGWERVTIPATQCPAFLDIIIAGTAPGATADGGKGATGGVTQIRDLAGNVLWEATGGNSTTGTYGLGNNTYRMRGGNGGVNQGGNEALLPGKQGSAGSLDPGGLGGPMGSPGENGASIPPGKIGVGSGAGGGGAGGLTGSGGRGGDGGWPSGPGGGGGAYSAFGTAGSGGIGGAGAVYISTRINEARTVGPSVPTNLAAGAISANGATITWAASTDDTRVTEYEILRGTAVVGYSTAPAFILNGLTPATAYTVKVRATDENGNWSGFSAPLTFTTAT